MCPPSGETHTYEFTVYAMPDASGIDGTTAADEALDTVSAESTSAAVLTGTYTRPELTPPERVVAGAAPLSRTTIRSPEGAGSTCDTRTERGVASSLRAPGRAHPFRHRDGSGGPR